MPSYKSSVTALLTKLRQYLPDEDVTLIQNAFAFAEKAHHGQTRMTGEPYITHPLAVATMLSSYQLDAQAISAALLHDVIEDSGVSKAELAEHFGSSVAELVDAVSKLDKLDFSSHQQAQAENFRKILLATARDVRVILIKLADRFHNMQTLSAMRPAKRRRIARETVDIYVPIAQRLGLNGLRRSLLDLSFQNLYPFRHGVLTRAIESVRQSRREHVDNVIASLRDHFQKNNLKASINGRERTPYSIYKEAQERHIPFTEVTESYDLRVLVETRNDCYVALGLLHERYKPIPGRFKDFIAIPKNNGYQSLHTTLFGPDNLPIKVQIRSQSMDLVAEVGIAAYWMLQSANDFSQLIETQQETRRWLKGLLDMQSEADSIEFVNSIKRDLFPEEIYVFTPKGDTRTLPRGATVLDFAYSIHTDIGQHCAGARINREVMPIRTVLHNGSVIEVITDPATHPSPNWLLFATTGRARVAIRHALRNQQEHEAVALGKQLLDFALKAFRIDEDAISKEQWTALGKPLGLRTANAIKAEIGRGKLLPFKVAQDLADKLQKSVKNAAARSALTLSGEHNEMLHYATCCRPIPNDPIIGMLRSDVGVEVHARDCPMLKTTAPNTEFINLNWPQPNPGTVYSSEISLLTVDRRGLLADLATAIAHTDTNIAQVILDRTSTPEFVTIRFLLDVKNRLHLAEVLRALRRVPSVKKVQRTRK